MSWLHTCCLSAPSPPSLPPWLAFLYSPLFPSPYFLLSFHRSRWPCARLAMSTQCACAGGKGLWEGSDVEVGQLRSHLCACLIQVHGCQPESYSLVNRIQSHVVSSSQFQFCCERLCREPLVHNSRLQSILAETWNSCSDHIHSQGQRKTDACMLSF